MKKPLSLIQACRDGKVYTGEASLCEMKRLTAAVASDEGKVSYSLACEMNEAGQKVFAFRASAELMLLCQNSLESYLHRMSIDQHFLLGHEQDRDKLPEGWEIWPLEQESILLADWVEDEVILALPMVPVNPDYELPEKYTSPGLQGVEPEAGKKNPFEVLAKLNITADSTGE